MKILKKLAKLFGSKRVQISFGIGVGIVLVVALAWLFHHNPIFSSFVAFVVSLIRAVAVVLLAWLTLRYFDRSSHLTFHQWSENTDAPYHQIALGIYFGLRCLAVFLAFAVCMA